jgi:hypothetical protein
MAEQRTLMVPLELRLVEEGRLAIAMEEAFGELQEEMIAYVAKHKDKAKNCTGALKVEITLKCESPETAFFSIKTQIKKQTPSPPPHVSQAIGQQTQTEQMRLFVKSTGSAGDSPEQGVFQNRDGEAVS